MKTGFFQIFGIGLLLGASALGGPIPAFPGAEGFGAHALGGRGGQVLFITNLLDYNPRKHEEVIAGSFRAACDTPGPRIVVFRVSGTVPLKDRIEITEPCITVAGQTAPGGGICLKNAEFVVRAQDVVVRHLRFRPGDELAAARHAEGKRYEPDCVSVGAPSHDVIIDHCSASWSVDECVSVSGEGINNVTIQWCLISESLNKSVHAKNAHGYGSLIRTNGNVTYHHNIYAHHSSRCPRPGTYGEGSILFDFRNNLLYDAWGYSSQDPVRMNYVGNYIKRPRNKIFQAGSETTHIFVQGNIVEDSENRALPILDDVLPDTISEDPFPTAPVTTQDARAAYEALVDRCGATLPRRDAVDSRVIAQIKAGTGELIDSQAEVGGWPTLEMAIALEDADNDGMPDAWERAQGLNPADGGDAAQDRDGDGYTNIEEYINGIGQPE